MSKPAARKPASRKPASTMAAASPADFGIAATVTHPAPVLASAARPPATQESHEHNLADFDWVPVLRKRRADGWTPAVQRRFIEVLADSGSVKFAAHTVRMSESSAYKLRRSPGAETFARAWVAAVDAAGRRLLDEAFERALVGTDEPVFDRDGRRVGRRFRQSDKMLQFLLRGYFPERFGYARQLGLPAGEPVHPTPIADELARLCPPVPPDVHKLLEPGLLASRLEAAAIGNGEVPLDLRDGTPENPAPGDLAIDPAFERELEDAKRAGRGLAPQSDAEWAEFSAPFAKDAYWDPRDEPQR